MGPGQQNTDQPIPGPKRGFGSGLPKEVRQLLLAYAPIDMKRAALMPGIAGVVTQFQLMAQFCARLGFLPDDYLMPYYEMLAAGYMTWLMDEYDKMYAADPDNMAIAAASDGAIEMDHSTGQWRLKAPLCPKRQSGVKAKNADCSKCELRGSIFCPVVDVVGALMRPPSASLPIVALPVSYQTPHEAMADKIKQMHKSLVRHVKAPHIYPYRTIAQAYDEGWGQAETDEVLNSRWKLVLELNREAMEDLDDIERQQKWFGNRTKWIKRAAYAGERYRQRWKSLFRLFGRLVGRGP